MRLSTPALDPSAWETHLDAEAGAFTVSLPRGWPSRVRLHRRGAALHQLVTASSPDGAASFFMSDPTIPSFVEPGGAPFGPTLGSVVQPFTSIEHLLPQYVHQRFGRLPGFRPGPMAPSPELFQLCAASAQSAGIGALWITAGRMTFSFDDGPHRVNALVFGSSCRLPPVWFADVVGLTTTGDVEDLAPALLGALATRRQTPEGEARLLQEREASAAAHRQTMATIDQNTAFLQASHRQNMGNLDAMARSHAAHMTSLHASHDAANAAWQAQQAGRDAAHTAALNVPEGDGHRRFLNLIAEERTVVDPDGNTWQVADGYDRYFRRRHDGAWIGTRSDRDLRGIPGIDPSHFDEVKIRV